MRTGFYSKFAVENIRKNSRLYIPRILTEAGLLGCFYILLTLALDKTLEKASGGAYLQIFMSIGTVVIGLLSFILIHYVNSFLMKRRKSEYGLYNVLGMEKRHVIKVLFSESLITSVLSVALGLVFGVTFYKLSSLLICKLLQTAPVTGFYYIEMKTLLIPAVIFFIFDLFAFISGSITIARLRPVQLLAGRKTGEKEPKIRWVLLVLGVLFLGAGYGIAIRTQSPLQAVGAFFYAVIFVIIGTYFLFVAGTTFVLKCLKNNKNYYYKSNHMPAVSGLLYRMKQNAVGLASIAILATGVLVMISTTVSLYSGARDIVEKNYPRHLYFSAYTVEDGDKHCPVSSEELSGIVKNSAEKYGVKIKEIDYVKYLNVSYQKEGNALLTREEANTGVNIEKISTAYYITDEMYRKCRSDKSDGAAGSLDLGKDEIAYCKICTNISSMMDNPETLKIHGKEYRIKTTLDHFPIDNIDNSLVNTYGIIVADDEALENIYQAQKKSYGENASEYSSRIGVSFEDLAAAAAAGREFTRDIEKTLLERYPDKVGYELKTKWEANRNIIDMNGTFLFLGILLGFVCLFSTILIIYYKQISEGYEDRERFQIMEKIGMDSKEVWKTIRSQIRLQFFLPLVTAGIHTAFAFPLLLKLLKILYLENTHLFINCTIVSFAVFALFYLAVYSMTAKTYYKIVH